MFDIGFSELLLVGIIALIVLGPERLPKAARSVGMFFGKIRRMMNNVQQEMEREIRMQELHEKLKDPLATFSEESLLKPDSKPAQTAPVETSAPLAPVPTGSQSLNTEIPVATPTPVKSDK